MKKIFALLIALLMALILIAGFAACASQTDESADEIDWAFFNERAIAYITALANGEFDLAVGMFDEELAQLLGASDLQEAWESVIVLVGDFVGIYEIQNEFVDGHYISYITVQHEDHGFAWDVFVTEEGLIAGILSSARGVIFFQGRNHWVPVLLVYFFVLALSVERIMGVFFEKRRVPRLVVLSSYLLFFASCYLLAVFLDYRPGTLTIISLLSLLAYFMVTLTYESSMKKRILAVFCCYLYIIILEVIVILGASAVLSGTLAVEYTLIHAEFIYLIAGVPIFAIASMLRRFKNVRKGAISSPIFWIPSILIPGFSLVIVSTIALLLPYVSHLPQLILTITILLFAINLLTFYLLDALSAAYEDKLKSVFHAQEKEYYFSQCELMQESVEKVKSIRHDMKTHLAALKGFTEGNEEATNYLNRLLGDIDGSEVYSDTGNIAFDSIINFKLKSILEDGIKLNIKIFIPPALNVEVIDVITILGNLLDNALDAVANVKDKRIKLDVSFDKDCLFINVENTFDGIVRYADDNVGEKVITTLKDGGEHGRGLKNVKNVVEKYKGHFDITHENNVFSVGILLYV